MTVQLSPHKVSKILRDYFCGLPQTKIAKQVAVDQSSISHYASRFKTMAAEVGILTAGEEYGVNNEVDTLRILSVELFKSKLTAEDAKQGHAIMKAFRRLGINPEQYLVLIGVCQKVDSPTFVEAAVRLAQIEAQSGMEYSRVMASLEEAHNHLPQLEGKISEAKVELKSISDTLLRKKQELVAQEEHLEEYEKEAKVRVAQTEAEILKRMKQLDVVKNEVEEVAALKVKLAKEGLDLETLVKLGKEFRHGSKGS